MRDEYYSKRYKMIDALDEMINDAMTSDVIDKAERWIANIFDEFKSVMVPMIIDNAMFEPRDYDDQSSAAFDVYSKPDMTKAQIMAALKSELDRLKIHKSKE